MQGAAHGKRVRLLVLQRSLDCAQHACGVTIQPDSWSASVLQVWRCPRCWVRVRVNCYHAQKRDPDESATSCGNMQAHNLRCGSTFDVETSPKMNVHGDCPIAPCDAVTYHHIRGDAAVHASGGWAVAVGARRT